MKVNFTDEEAESLAREKILSTSVDENYTALYPLPIDVDDDIECEPGVASF